MFNFVRRLLIYILFITTMVTKCAVFTEVPTYSKKPTPTAAPTEDVPIDAIEELINYNLDILTAGDYSVFSTPDIIDDHPDEFAAIVALGEIAIPYLDAIIVNYTYLDGDIGYKRMIIAMHVKYAIKPELYDLVFTSPDGKYAVKASVYSFAKIGTHTAGTDYCDVRLVDCATDSVIVTSRWDIYNNIEVEWSPDCRYAAISYGDGRYFDLTDVFDVRNAKYIVLTRDSEVETIIWDDLDARFDNTMFYFNEWIADDKIKITIALVNSYMQELSGWYIYDLVENEIVDIDYHYIDSE